MNQLGYKQFGNWSPAREGGKEQASDYDDANADDDNDDDDDADADAKVDDDDDGDNDDDSETLFEFQDLKAWNNYLILMWDIN